MENNGKEQESTEGPSPDKRVLPLIRGETTLSDALDNEDNMLLRLSYPKKRFALYLDIYGLRHRLAILCAHDLGLGAGETCVVSEPAEWIHGSFNVCVPVDVLNWKKHPGKRVLLRFPLPYKTGDCCDEKLRTEAATYLWMQQNCPDVPVPFLWSFALPGGQVFLRQENAPLFARLRWYYQRVVGLFTGRSTQHPYVSVLRTTAENVHVPIQRATVLENGYLLLDYIDGKVGTMLSESWYLDDQDPHRRENLFRSLARIMLSVGRIPQSRIGSWTIDVQGKLSLTNRPLLHHLCSFENQGIPPGISRTMTYNDTETFYADLLSGHENRILHQQNSIVSENDGFTQMACLFAMRGLIRNFADASCRYGPFIFALTDLHASNIFVDESWNITCIIDLEWACSLPAELQGPPTWLAEDFEAEGLEKYDMLRQEFMAIFEDEEKALHGPAAVKSDLMKKGWQNGGFWFFHALTSPGGCYNLFKGNIRPLFVPDVDMKELGRYLGPFWCLNARQVVERKLADKEKYEAQVKEVFAKPPVDEDEDEGE